MITRESPQEMLARLQMMASGDPKWDLSDNDEIAISWAVKTIEIMAARLDSTIARDHRIK